MLCCRFRSSPLLLKQPMTGSRLLPPQIKPAPTAPVKSAKEAEITTSIRMMIPTAAKNGLQTGGTVTARSITQTDMTGTRETSLVRGIAGIRIPEPLMTAPCIGIGIEMHLEIEPPIQAREGRVVKKQTRNRMEQVKLLALHMMIGMHSACYARLPTKLTRSGATGCRACLSCSAHTLPLSQRLESWAILACCSLYVLLCCTLPLPFCALLLFMPCFSPCPAVCHCISSSAVCYALLCVIPCCVLCPALFHAPRCDLPWTVWWACSVSCPALFYALLGPMPSSAGLPLAKPHSAKPCSSLMCRPRFEMLLTSSDVVCQARGCRERVRGCCCDSGRQ